MDNLRKQALRFGFELKIIIISFFRRIIIILCYYNTILQLQKLLLPDYCRPSTFRYSWREISD